MARTQVPSRGKPPMGRSNLERMTAYLMLQRKKSSPVAPETRAVTKMDHNRDVSRVVCI